MPQTQTRRSFLSMAVLAGAAGLLSPRRGSAAEPALETTTVRLARAPVICFAPQYVCEALLRADGFTDVRYVDRTSQGNWKTSGVAISISIRACRSRTLSRSITGGRSPSSPVCTLAAMSFSVHGGIRGIADLKGKSVGHGGSTELISMMAAYVGLDPKKDLTLVDDPAAKPVDLFAEGKLDAYLAFPPEVQELHAPKVGHVILRTAVDRPWSQYFCCMMAANREYAARYPVATKRVIRAVLKAADLCASEPEVAARLIVQGGFTERYDYALQTLTENPYGAWREYDAEDTIRFYALRLHELGMIKSSPQKIIADGADWRFLDEIKREMKA